MIKFSATLLATLIAASVPHRLKLVVAKMTRQAMWRWKKAS